MGFCKLRVLVGDLTHGLLHLLHNEDDENERQDAADGHDKRDGRKDLGIGHGARKSQAEGIECCLSGDALIGEVAYDRESDPRQDDAQRVCEHDDRCENRDGGRDSEQCARHNGVLQCISCYSEFFALFPCLDEKEKRLRYDEDDDKKTESYHKAVFLKVFRDHKNTSYKISAYYTCQP